MRSLRRVNLRQLLKERNRMCRAKRVIFKSSYILKQSEILINKYIKLINI